MHAADSDAEPHVSEDEAGKHTAHAGGSQDGSVYEDGTEGSKSHDAGKVTNLRTTWHRFILTVEPSSHTKQECDFIGLYSCGGLKSLSGRPMYIRSLGPETCQNIQFCVCLHADPDDGSEYQDGSEGEEELDSHSGDEDKASADEVLGEVVDDLAEEEGSYEDSLEDVGGSDDESID